MTHSNLPEWQVLKQIATHIPSLRELFASDPQRKEKLILHAAGIKADLSKNHTTPEIQETLLELARATGVPEEIERMFTGDNELNNTENRAVGHFALRLPEGESGLINGKDVNPEVHAVLHHMEDFTSKVKSGEWTGYTGKKIKKVVTIGIGGSSLGPEAACEALKDYQDDSLEFTFVSNIDPVPMADVIRNFDPEETLFIIASKTFKTEEVKHNAQDAKQWILETFHDDKAIAKHFVAISTNKQKVEEFGIDSKNMFEFWDWVGGRFSLSSAIGLPIMLEIGPERFKEMLAGFHEMDEHFRHAPLEQNLPVLMALNQILNVDFLNHPDLAIVPYSDRLKKLPNHLQQLLMESLGKSVTKDGVTVDYQTGATILGGAGTDLQHSVFQSFQEGHVIPAIFIGFEKNSVTNHASESFQDSWKEKQKILNANLKAQAEVLAFGVTADELRKKEVPENLIPHKIHPGNRSSTTLWLDKLTPSNFGKLIALFEHMTFVWGTVLGVNPFDQFGVEAGKEKAKEILAAI